MNMAELTALPFTQDNAHDPSPAWPADVLAGRVRELDAGLATDWADAKIRLLATAAQINHERDV